MPKVYAGDLIANSAIGDLIKDATKLKGKLDTAKRYGYEISGDVLMGIINGDIKTVADVKAAVTPDKN